MAVLPPTSSTSAAHTAPVAVLLLLWLGLVLTSHPAVAYSVRYSAVNSDVGYSDFTTTDFCAMAGGSAHTMMPKTASFQTEALDVFSSLQFSEAAIGGIARQAACLDANCTWQYYKGLHRSNEMTFYYGVVRDGILQGHDDPSVFHNFKVGQQPLWWSNVSYWGMRQVYMTRDGTWANTHVNHLFTEWVCEDYVYTPSDSVYFPTYPNGDVIAPQTGENESYVYCGHPIVIDDEGRWVYERCSTPFNWWAGVLIAIGATIVFYIFFIAAWLYIAAYCRGRMAAKIRREMELANARTGDAPSGAAV